MPSAASSPISSMRAPLFEGAYEALMQRAGFAISASFGRGAGFAAQPDLGMVEHRLFLTAEAPRRIQGLARRAVHFPEVARHLGDFRKWHGTPASPECGAVPRRSGTAGARPCRDPGCAGIRRPRPNGAEIAEAGALHQRFQYPPFE